MEIKNVRDLSKIADLCRKKGIEQIKIGENCIELKLGDKPERRHHSAKSVKGEADKPMPPSGPTDEELLFWSSGGLSTDKQFEPEA